MSDRLIGWLVGSLIGGLDVFRWLLDRLLVVFYWLVDRRLADCFISRLLDGLLA